MPWKALPSFCVCGTNVPIQLLEKFRFNDTYAAIVRMVTTETALKTRAAEFLAQLRTIRFSEDHRKRWRKLQNRLAAGANLSPHDAVLEEDRSIPSDLCAGLQEWQRQREALPRFEAEAREIFRAEMTSRRTLLWKLVRDPKVREGIFQLNPQFLNHLDKYAASWDQNPRDSEMRKKENTLVSYLLRFCAKNSAAGSLGPTFEGRFTRTGVKTLGFRWLPKAGVRDGIDQRKAFYAYWAMEAVADRMKEDPELRLRLPLRLHPAVLASGLELVALIEDKEARFTPALKRIGISKKARDLISRLNGSRSALRLLRSVPSLPGGGDLADEILGLLKQNFLLDGCTIPPGTVHFLTYLRELLGKAGPEHPTVVRWREVIERFEQMRLAFEEGDSGQKHRILDEAETFFTEVTGAQSRRGEGQYYADRFILYEDCRRASKPLSVGPTLKKRILNEYTFALELMAPFWLYQVLPLVVLAENGTRELKSLGPKISQEEFLNELVKLAQRLLEARGKPLSEDLKKQKPVLRWLIGIAELLRRAKDLLAAVPMDAREYAFDASDPKVRTYRRRLGQIMARGKPLLPLFASGPILQVAARDLAELSGEQSRLVFDSVIFGNSMNLTVLDYFSVDRDRQMREQETLLKKLLGVRDRRLADFVWISRQPSKFTSWIRGGVDIELTGPSFKRDPDRIPISHIRASMRAPGGPSGKSIGPGPSLHIGYPHDVRLSRKLVLEDFAGHCPRLRFGKTVIQRENWRVSGQELCPKPRSAPDPFLDYVDLIRTKIARGFPDEVFVDPSGPKKNILIDFRNFFCAEVLFGLARGNEQLRISEMFPSSSDFWLPSPSDDTQRYTVGLMPFLYYEPTRKK